MATYIHIPTNTTVPIYPPPPPASYEPRRIIPHIRPASLGSRSSETSCPDAGSTALSCSKQAADIEENSGVKPVHPFKSKFGRNILKEDSTAEPIRSCTPSAGREIITDSSYRMETEYLKGPAMHASFVIDNANRVKIKHLPERIKDGIRTLLEKCWEHGIQKESPSANDEEGYYFKLKKRPFGSRSPHLVTRMIRNMIAYLASECWLVQPVPSILNPYDTLNFRKCAKPLPKCYWLAITYARGGKWSFKDRLSVLGGADELIDTIRLTLQEMDLVPKFKKEHADAANNWHEFGIKSTFLSFRGPGKKKTMMLRIMERLEERGWVLYVGYHRIYHEGSDYEVRIGTWLCVKSREWTPTNPVKIRWAD